MSRRRWGKSKSRTSPGALVLGVLVAGIVVVLARMGKLLVLLKGLGQALGGAVKNVAGGVRTVGEQAAGGAQTVGEQAAGGVQTVGEQAAGGMQTLGDQVAPPAKGDD